MKAIVYTEYGPPDVLELKEVDKPVPTDFEVLVNVHAASLTYSNLFLVSGKPFPLRLIFGLLRPELTIPGSDMAGRVEAVGGSVQKFRPGDEVFGDLSRCGRGGFTEYVCAPESAMALKPGRQGETGDRQVFPAERDRGSFPLLRRRACPGKSGDHH